MWRCIIHHFPHLEIIIEAVKRSKSSSRHQIEELLTKQKTRGQQQKLMVVKRGYIVLVRHLAALSRLKPGKVPAKKDV